MRAAGRAVSAVALLAVLGGATAADLALRGDDPPAAAPTASTAAPAVPVRGPLLTSSADAPSPIAAGLAGALAPALADPALGPAVAAVVVDATTGATLLDRQGATPVVPASTTKLVTAVAVLTGLPEGTRLSTRVLAGPAPGDVVLVGGGDVTLAGAAAGPGGPADAAPARLSDLAAQTRAALAGTPVARVLVDDSLYAAPTAGPAWKPSYFAGDVAPVQALSVDAGRVGAGRPARVADPALAAGQALAGLLGGGSAVRGTAAPGAAQLAQVQSPPVADLVEQMLTNSDNDLAESLAHRLAVERGLPATFAGGAQATRDVLAGLVPAGSVGLVDGSGLSPDDRVQPAAVVALLTRAVADRTGRLGPVLSGLPVAGFDGTLASRYRAGPTVPAAGQVRAKTGTLLGVSALAGLARTADGRLLAFDVTLNAVPSGGTRAAEAALDRVATALTACGCR